MASIAKAKMFFENFIIPRRVRDFDAERAYANKHGSSPIKFRRVQRDEIDRGEVYPVCSAGLDTFAQFGIGIGLYFFQLLILVGVTFLCSIIMISTINEYYKSSYGYTEDSVNSKVDGFLLISAACPNEVNVTASIGCGVGNSTCEVLHRPNCELSYRVIAADLIMSLVFFAAIFVSKLLEDKIVEELDEAIQTTQDYSLQVMDPPKNADDPDEWYEFFSRFGQVRYITILRNNKSLIKSLLAFHLLNLKMKELSELPNGTETKAFKSLAKKRSRYLEAFNKSYRMQYPVTRVYVTFEYEEHQRLCLKELEVPDFYAIFDIKDFSKAIKLFRANSVLNIKEPPEPSNILWANLMRSGFLKRLRRISSRLMTLGVFVAVWYILSYTQRTNIGILSLVIGVLDSLLPSILGMLVKFSCPDDEGARQGLLQVRLFAARLLLSTVMPYIQTQWHNVLNPIFIAQIISIQVFACFYALIIQYFDIAGVVNRQILSRLFSSTQSEMNQFWHGSEWTLADQYTGIAKVLFVSVYYAMLTPISIFFAMVAYLGMFFINRYLLLRKWKAQPLLNEKIALLLRQEVMLAIAAHMFVTIRFIYSWPMDQAFWNGKAYEKVDKFPTYLIWTMSSEEWQSTGTQKLLFVYKVATLVIIAITLFVWIIQPLLIKLFELFCYNLKKVGETQGLKFSELDEVDVYEPLIQVRERFFLCSHIIDFLHSKHRPYVPNSEQDPGDLSFYVPEAHRPHVLSIVKYFGDTPESGLEPVFPKGALSFDEPIPLNASNYNRGDASSKMLSPYLSTLGMNKYSLITDTTGKLQRTTKKSEVPVSLLERIQPRIVEEQKPSGSESVRRSRSVELSDVMGGASGASSSRRVNSSRIVPQGISQRG